MENSVEKIDYYYLDARAELIKSDVDFLIRRSIMAVAAKDYLQDRVTMKEHVQHCAEVNGVLEKAERTYQDWIGDASRTSRIGHAVIREVPERNSNRQ